MPNIINNLFSSLNQESKGNNNYLVTYTVRNTCFFNSPKSRSLLINLNIVEENHKLLIVRDYILERIKPSSNLRGAKLRFEKLCIANKLLITLKDESKDLVEELEKLYNKAEQLENCELSCAMVSFPKPLGKLGEILINLRKRYDLDFQEKYTQMVNDAASEALARCPSTNGGI